MNKLNKCDAAIIGVLVYAASVQPAYAYVDPGSVSLVVTAILGGIASVGYTIRLYWSKVRDFFSRSRGSHHDDTTGRGHQP